MTHNLVRLRQISEPSLHPPFRSSIVLAAIALALTLPLAGCGRKGPLDPPPGGYGLDRSVVRTPVSRRGAQAPLQEKQDYDAEGRPIVPEGQKKPFILDPLIK
jgi:predicted small lipoprotein YifL